MPRARSRRNAGFLLQHRLSQGPCRCSALGDARASRSRGGLRGGKPYNGLQDMAAFSAEGTPDGTAARSHGAIRAPRLLLDIRAQVPDVDQRENLLNHRLATAFDQLARVVPQLADQPLPPPPQPFDRSTNIVQREQPCLFLFHEALLSAADGAV